MTKRKGKPELITPARYDYVLDIGRGADSIAHLTYSVVVNDNYLRQKELDAEALIKLASTLNARATLLRQEAKREREAEI